MSPDRGWLQGSEGGKAMSPPPRRSRLQACRLLATPG